MSQETNSKIIVNGISMYMMLLLAWIFLFPFSFIKRNPLFNNAFVRSHATTATFLHILLLVNIIVFLVFKLFAEIDIFGFGLNLILADIIFAFLFISMGISIYKASQGNTFTVGDSITLRKKQIVSVNKEASRHSEEDKLSFLFSYIPFLGFIKTAKYSKNTAISANLTFNIVISSIITVIYIFWYQNIANFFVLLYTIFIAFAGVNIFIKNEILHIGLPNFFKVENNLLIFKSTLIYLKKYLTGKFQEYQNILENEKNKKIQKQQALLEKAQKQAPFRGPKSIIYIPIVNLITLFQRHSQYQTHIINGCIITLFFLISIVFFVFWKISLSFFILFLFPICFGIWKLHSPVYLMPYVFDFYEFLWYIKNMFHSTKQTIKEKQAETYEESFKVGEK